jgi:hypothetical protein
MDQVHAHLVCGAIESGFLAVLDEANVMAFRIANAKMTIAAFRPLEVRYCDTQRIKVVAGLINVWGFEGDFGNPTIVFRPVRREKTEKLMIV